MATDVAARGIDVDDVTHVINYQCVEDEKIYLHRVGRTGRAGNKGTAVTFVDWDDMPRWGLINKALGLSYPEPVETYSSSPHLFEELDIPAGTKGRLPRDKRTLAGVDAEVLEDLGETGKKTPVPEAIPGVDAPLAPAGAMVAVKVHAAVPSPATLRPAKETVMAAATARAAVVRPKAKQPPLRVRPSLPSPNPGRHSPARAPTSRPAHAAPAPAAATAKWSPLPVHPARAPRLNGLND